MKARKWFRVSWIDAAHPQVRRRNLFASRRHVRSPPAVRGRRGFSRQIVIVPRCSCCPAPKLPLLWRFALGHPNLLPAFFEGDINPSALGDSWVRKPMHSKEGANITIMERGAAAARTGGSYDGPAVLQAFHPLPDRPPLGGPV